ncbi:VanZ family protein [Heliobacterium chlorum]|uniref:VanZ family protein n=1 Tax=Heliobacterium chlorum TaxID=2698 RepID=A0ABR7T1I4_HELCL|nr:VanZ family protein [Heliobacterium chlorum]MBC9783997.1 VanZ family protein [Heliobacterium chlorum]
MRKLMYWSLLLLWMGIMFWLSSIPNLRVLPVLYLIVAWLDIPWPVLKTSGFALEFILRKTAHVTEYAILTGLWLQAAKSTWLWSRRRHLWTAFFFSLAFAVTDEIHQELTGFRDGRLMDVGIDSLGIVIALIIGFVLFKSLKDGAHDKQQNS